VSMEAGIERSDEFTVEGRLLTDVGGTLPVKVLSTPGMISMMERCASILAFEQLPDGKATVGFEVCIKHVAAAGEGSSCTVHARLNEMIDERKLRFSVEVREGDRTIGVGTHERRVVERAGFLQSP
jgi:fluoroacetyl-CoA thioesterase